MVGKTVQLYLKTPLFRFGYESGGESKRFPPGIVVVEGKIVSEEGGGFLLDVLRIGKMDGELSDDTSGLGQAFVPTGKVDFARFLP